MHTVVRYRHPGGNAREQNSPVSLVESVWITRNRGHEWPAYRRDRYECLEVVLKHQADAMASGYEPGWSSITAIASGEATAKRWCWGSSAMGGSVVLGPNDTAILCSALDIWPPHDYLACCYFNQFWMLVEGYDKVLSDWHQHSGWFFQVGIRAAAVLSYIIRFP